MKRVIAVFLSIIVTCTAIAIAAEEEQEPDHSAVQARFDPNSKTIFVGVDILGIRFYKPSEWARNVWAPLRIFTYPADWCVYMGTKHPFQSAALVLGGIELKTGKVSDAAEDVWDGITGLFGGDDDDEDSPEPLPTPTPQPGTEQTGSNNSTVNGSGNTITQTTTYNWHLTPTPTPTPTPAPFSASMGGW